MPMTKKLLLEMREEFCNLMNFSDSKNSSLEDMGWAQVRHLGVSGPFQQFRLQFGKNFEGVFLATKNFKLKALANNCYGNLNLKSFHSKELYSPVLIHRVRNKDNQLYIGMVYFDCNYDSKRKVGLYRVYIDMNFPEGIEDSLLKPSGIKGMGCNLNEAY